MGNTINFVDSINNGPDQDSVSFFLSISSKNTKTVFAKVQENLLSEFDVTNTTESLSWRQYFSIFSELKDKLERERDVAKRTTWHPATIGYEMLRKDNPSDLDDSEDQEGLGNIDGAIEDIHILPDDHTDDELIAPRDRENPRDKLLSPSLIDAQLTQESRKVASSKAYNYSNISPIFFGYSRSTTTVRAKELADQKAKQVAVEKKAIENVKSSRASLIDSFEKQVNAFAAAREKKIADVESKYEASAKTRERDFEKNKRSLPAPAFKVFEAQWKAEAISISSAHTYELGAMKSLHELKTEQDMLELRRMREELEAFKDAEKQELPTAEKLEELSRIEMVRCIDNLSKKAQELETAKAEYAEMTKALVVQRGIAPSDTASVEKKAEMKQLKSMVNVASTTVLEKVKGVESAIAALADGETLLNRAGRIRKEQDLFLPFFRLIADSDNPRPGSCPINYLIVGMIILTWGTFDQKYNLLVSVFDNSGEGNFSALFIEFFLTIMQKALKLLQYIPTAPIREEISNLVYRHFNDLGLKPETDILTQYETRQFFITLISQNHLLSKAFGLSNLSSRMGVYQLNRMSAVSLLTRGIIGPSICKYRVHYEKTRYRPELDPDHRRIIHERALAMGVDDPYRPDYSRYVKKEQRETAGRIDPLYHGHLMNIKYVETRLQYFSALRIQTYYRSRRERRLADLAFKKQAFYESKERAMKEMKDRIVKEFRSREASSGVAKMKWDAQVRMRQTKLRAGGQAVSRSDMVMILLEETIAQAREDLEASFTELEAKEDFSKVNFGKVHDRCMELSEVRFTEVDLYALFGLVAEAGVGDLMSEKEKEDAHNKSPAQQGAGDGNVGKEPEKLEEEHSGDKVTESGSLLDRYSPRLSLDMKLALIRGSFSRVDSNNKGELMIQSDLRLSMAFPEPTSSRFYNRLRLLHEAMTHLKAENLMAELPSKRLLLKYVTHHGRDSLIEELVKHFRFRRGAMECAEVLLRLVGSDAEYGVMKRELTLLQRDIDIGLKYLAMGDETQAVLNFSEYVHQRMRAGELVNDDKVKNGEDGFVELELEALASSAAKLKKVSDEISDNMDSMRTRLVRLKMSQTECARRVRAANRLLIQLREEKEKNKTGGDSKQLMTVAASTDLLTLDALKAVATTEPFSQHDKDFAALSVILDLQVHLDDRFDWMRRMQTALGFAGSAYAFAYLPNDDDKDLVSSVPMGADPKAHSKYTEIQSLCREFLEVARSDAVVIVSELFHPRHMKTIPVSSTRPVHGRVVECGRGYEDGKYYTYEAHNISYQVCEDYNGVFNGSDEHAAKVAGNERVASLEYFRLQIPKLSIPLIATIDYGGFRILAEAKLPSQTATFGSDFEVRRLSEEMVHGVVNMGDKFVNKSKMVQQLLSSAAKKLHLSDHYCKGFQDIAGSMTSGSSELKIYRVSRMDHIKKIKVDDYYAKDFFRSFPSEVPTETLHLLRTPRDQSVFWRILRPEFCRLFPQPLSPDACSTIVSGAPDRDKQYNDVQNATRFLVESVIPNFAEDLAARDYHLPVSSGLGLNLSVELHSRGINLRHLGLMRSLLWRELPGTFNLFFYESHIRSSRDLRREVRPGDRIIIDGEEHLITESPGNLITHQTLPLGNIYKSDSKYKVKAMAGSILCRKNNEELSTVLLGEIVARCIKSLVQMQLRNYARKERTVSPAAILVVSAEYLNIVTGASARSSEVLENLVFEVALEKFGLFAIRPSERRILVALIKPCLLFVVRRIQTLLGIRLSSGCLAELQERPVGFFFHPADITEVFPVVHHNMAILTLSEALLVSIKAHEVENESYVGQVLKDAPSAFFKLSERKGASTAENHGGKVLQAFSDPVMVHLNDKRQGVHGKFLGRVELEQPGPMVHEPFIRAAGFGGDVSKGFIEVKLHPLIVPQNLEESFSVEAFCKLVPGLEATLRYAVMSGRYALVVSRDNYWTFVLLQGMHELSVRIAPAVLGHWTHIVGAFDGTTLRCYIDSILCASLEVEAPTNALIFEFEESIRLKREELKGAEIVARDMLKRETQLAAEKYFISKIGSATLKKQAKDLMDSPEFNTEHSLSVAEQQQEEVKESVIDLSTGHSQYDKDRKAKAMAQVRKKYIFDLYTQNVRAVAEKYRQLEKDVDDEVTGKLEAGELRLRKGLRIGSSVNTGSSLGHGENHFVGMISCVAVYNTTLSSDRVRAHFIAAGTDHNKHTQRFYSEALLRYEDGLRVVPDDVMLMQEYARALCKYVTLEVAEGISVQSEIGLTKGKIRISAAIRMFEARSVPDGIANLIRLLPRDIEFASLVCECFQALRRTDRFFFSRGHILKRKDLVFIPNVYAFDHPSSPRECMEIAAWIYQEVVKDEDLRYVYGERDMAWICDLKSPELIVGIIQRANEELNLHVLKFADIYQQANRTDNISINDEEVAIVIRNLTTSVSFDFSGCHLLSDRTVEALLRLKNLRNLNLDGCVSVTDYGMNLLKGAASKLETLSFAGLKITDTGLGPLLEACASLTCLILNNCSNVGWEAISRLKNKSNVKMLGLSATTLTDDDLSQLSAAFAGDSLTNIDISFCRNITDFGVRSLGESCPAIRVFNAMSVSRVTDEGIRYLCTKAWNLETLIIEDLFLLRDRVFHYDYTFDGRHMADMKMLKNLVTLNLRECVHITDEAIRGLAERCRAIEFLHLNGCDKLTDKALSYMTDTFAEETSMCESIRTLDISFCRLITPSGILNVIGAFGMLDELFISGHASLNDSFMSQLCLLRPTIQKLYVQRCVLLSDASLCSMADHLWIEHLDLMGCSKITDGGIEALSSACTGILGLNLQRLTKITSRSLYSVARNCKGITLINIKECPLVSQIGIEDFKRTRHLAVVLTSY